MIGAERKAARFRGRLCGRFIDGSKITSIVSKQTMVVAQGL